VAGADEAPRALVVLVRDDHELELGPVDARGSCDLALIDDLLRLRLGAQRLGWRLELRDLAADLRDLIAFVGVADLLGG
jgi:hypothetical protein